MAKLTIKKATTSTALYIFVQNSSVSTGAGLTGLVFNSASLVAYYVRPLAAAVAITLATQTVTGAFSSGGFVEVDATNMPGVYRFDVPDLALATGVNSVVVMLKGATNMVPVVLEIDLTAYDPQSATSLGLTNLDAAITTRLAPTVAARTLDVTATGAAGIDWANVENPTTALNLSATNIDVDQIVASVSGAVGSVTGAVGSVTGSVGSVTANVNAVLINGAHGGAAATAQFGGAGGITSNLTGNVTGSVGSVTGAVGSVAGAVGSVTAGVTVSTNSDKAGYALTSADHVVGADTLLDRNMATGSDSGSPTVRTVRQALRFLRNKWSITAGTLTVTKEDDVTTSFTATVTTDAAAVPIVGNDPA